MNISSGCPAPNLFYPSKRVKYKSTRHSWPGGYISCIAKVKDIDWKMRKPSRAGIIIYSKFQDKVLFCVGVDRKSKELTDFGGGVSYKLDKDALTGAIREFTEESLGVFGGLKPEELQECIAVYTQIMLIIFVPMICNPLEANRLFLSRYTREKVGEVSGLVWMDVESFLTTLYAKKRFYVRVYKLLNPVILKVLALL